MHVNDVAIPNGTVSNVKRLLTSKILTCAVVADGSSALTVELVDATFERLIVLTVEPTLKPRKF